jgi:hypothetical protein
MQEAIEVGYQVEAVNSCSKLDRRLRRAIGTHTMLKSPAPDLYCASNQVNRWTRFGVCYLRSK